MKLKLVPILSTMEELYSQPISVDRFKTYINKLQGSRKGDLELPIGGYNPMAKDHIKQKISELQSLDAEALMSQALQKVELKGFDEGSIEVVLNLADDLKGGWTNRYSTDFDSKFKLNALVERGFCTPYFWSSEDYSAELITNRTLEYVYRTLYWREHPRLKTLEDHVKQEIYVSQCMRVDASIPDALALKHMEELYDEYSQEDDYSLLFNFFYRDEASASLGYTCYGVSRINGFEYARWLARR